MFHRVSVFLVLAICSCLVGGCGSTKSRSATEQLLLSDAVDRAVASIDFRPLSGRTVYLDTKYLQSAKSSTGFVNADYIISSIRQQMLAANCFLEEEQAKAEYIAEIRVGALGTDAHNITYGVPQSNGLSTVASFVPNAPPVPAIPEIALAKKEDEVAAAKIALFAYHRETRQAVWQSGIAQARSAAKDLWFFGAGPFQRGNIHDGMQFAGGDLELPLVANDANDRSKDRLELYGQRMSFVQPPEPEPEPEPKTDAGTVQPAGHEQPAESGPAAEASPSAPQAATPAAAASEASASPPSS
jgi:hypothetical protein